jgi:hypothetical protein
MILELIRVALIAEAITFILFTAGPLQARRAAFVALTPFLRSGPGNVHVLECPHCSGWWILQVVFLLWWFWPASLFFQSLNLFICYRLMIFLHDIFVISENIGMNLFLWRSKK